jgi:hypothetical protein
MEKARTRVLKCSVTHRSEPRSISTAIHRRGFDNEPRGRPTRPRPAFAATSPSSPRKVRQGAGSTQRSGKGGLPVPGWRTRTRSSLAGRHNGNRTAKARERSQDFLPGWRRRTLLDGNTAGLQPKPEPRPPDKPPCSPNLRKPLPGGSTSRAVTPRRWRGEY